MTTSTSSSPRASDGHLSLWDFLSTKSSDGSRCPIRGLLSFARPLFNGSPSTNHLWGWLLLAAMAVSTLMVLQLQP